MNTTNGTTPEAKKPLFTPLEWVSPRDMADTGRYRMLATIRDLAAGVAVALEMVERSSVLADLGDAPLMAPHDASRLTRMSIAAMHVIEGHIDEHFDEMSESASRRRLSEADGDAS